MSHGKQCFRALRNWQRLQKRKKQESLISKSLERLSLEWRFFIPSGASFLNYLGATKEIEKCVPQASSKCEGQGCHSMLQCKGKVRQIRKACVHNLG